jgi:hypothetical protein
VDPIYHKGFNHLARLLLITLNASCMFGAVEASSSSREISGQALWYAFLSYAMVWLSAMVPGYVNDRLFQRLDNTLDGWLEDDSALVLDPVFLELVCLVQLSKGRKGMAFGHVSMSVARAALVGTLISYLVKVVIFACAFGRSNGGK